MVQALPARNNPRTPAQIKQRHHLTVREFLLPHLLQDSKLKLRAVATRFATQSYVPVLAVLVYPQTHHRLIDAVFGTKRSVAANACQVFLNYLLLESLVISRHEKHPKGWTGVQLLGCSSAQRAFVLGA